jgi:undecaprenyl-diphosphatase
MENKKEKIWLTGLLALFVLMALLLHVEQVILIDYMWTERIADFWGNHLVAVTVDLISEGTIGSYVGVLTVLIYLLWEGKKKFAYQYAYWLGLLFVASFILKNFFGRMRPYVVIDTVQNLSSGLVTDNLSFPSSHSAIAFFTAYFLVDKLRLNGWSKWGMYSFALLVALTRIYLGVHSVIDVIAGISLGLFFGILMKVVINKK